MIGVRVGPSSQQTIKNCRGIEKKGEKPRRFRARHVILYVSSRAGDFCDKYRRRIVTQSIWSVNRNKDNNVLLTCLFLYLYYASYNNYCVDVDCILNVNCFVYRFYLAIYGRGLCGCGYV